MHTFHCYSTSIICKSLPIISSPFYSLTQFYRKSIFQFLYTHSYLKKTRMLYRPEETRIIYKKGIRSRRTLQMKSIFAKKKYFMYPIVHPVQMMIIVYLYWHQTSCSDSYIHIVMPHAIHRHNTKYSGSVQNDQFFNSISNDFLIVILI